MPLISTVGQRAPSVRLLHAGMYILLLLGAVTMAYPFLLMLSMSTAGRGESREFRLVPRFWTSDAALFKRYLLDTVPYLTPAWRPGEEVPASELASWFGKDHWYLPRDVREEDLRDVMATPAAQRLAMARDVEDFLAAGCPARFKLPCAMFDADSALALRSDYHAWLAARYGNLDHVNRLYADTAASWDDVQPFVEMMNRQPGDSRREKDWREFLETRPPGRTALLNADQLVFTYLRGRTLPASYRGPVDSAGEPIRALVTFDALDAGELGPDHREQFYRSFAPLRFLLIDTAAAAPAWREHLRACRAQEDLPLEARMPQGTHVAGLWSRFVQGPCPTGALRLERPEVAWRGFLEQRHGSIGALNRLYGASHADFSRVRIPWAVFKYDRYLQEKPGLRQRYMLHNFKTVLAFITVHGAALRVTLIYIILMVGGALTINPLAAYAMSRFRLRESHHILMFLLATMAFPGEVLMIPGFLLVKSFPWLQLLVVIACLALFYVAVRRFGRRLPLLLSATLALAATLFLTGWAVPALAQRFDASISANLMNTFWALILPGLANGYGIFLLKGFFDTLPPELYEAGLIDGASEMRMFWQITLPLCRPILAIIALGAFTTAYGAFMHAFLTCQDPKMWTFMVFLYEFQQLHTVPMIMASLVVAAVPTLLLFVCCQNIILRGIVIPTFK
ncbi:MAG: carbohydrate ABC transporter permease [bacterium]